MGRTVDRRGPLGGHSTFIRAWRQYRKLSQEALAEAIGKSHTTVGRIERGEMPYNQAFLERAAGVLDCSPGDLLMRDPRESEDIWAIWQRLNPTERRRAVLILRALDATEGDE